ncbi:MAG TPA: hypothetical protein VFZ85_05030 [Jiangellaceae bacterium]
MLALALVLLLLVAILVVASFVGSSEEVVIEFLNVTVTTSVGGVFVAGFVAGLIALASLYSIRTSVKRIQQRRSEVRELRRQAGQTAPAGAESDRARRADTEATTRGGGDTAELDGPAGPPASDNPPGRSADADGDTQSDSHRS